MCRDCLITMNKVARARRKKNSKAGTCIHCGAAKPISAKTCDECRHKVRKLRHKYTDMIFAHYGAICKCCGECERTFLSIDHVNNDGAEQRRKLRTQLQILRWIITNNYPDSIQILCYNCQRGKYVHGSCPHQRKESHVLQHSARTIQ